MAIMRAFLRLCPAQSCLSQSRRLISTSDALGGSTKLNLFNINFDRRIKVDYRDSIKYMDSEAYKTTYQGHLVWKLYRRNHKLPFPAKNTRPNCINAEGFISTSYPCPICRDEYLVLHPENWKLLQQFIDPYTGRTFTVKEHGLCQKQYHNLIIAMYRAKDLGTLDYEITDRIYDYKEYSDCCERHRAHQIERSA